MEFNNRKNITSGAKKDVLYSKLAVLPTLNANANHLYSLGRTLNTETYQYINSNIEMGGIGANTRMDIFSGLQGLYQIQQAKYNYLASMEDLKLAKNNVSISISGAYLSILLCKELLEVAEKNC